MSAPILTDFVNGIGTVTGDMLNSFLQGSLTVAQLRSFPGQPNMQVSVLGISAPNDGGAGVFYWNATATGTDNNYSFIVPQGGVAGAWIRLASLAIAANFTTTDTGAIDAMVGIYNPVITTYANGMVLYITPLYSNTGPTTFNGGGGVRSVVGPAGALQGGEIIEAQTLGLQYSAANNNFLIVSGWGATQGNSATGSNQFVTLDQLGSSGGNPTATFQAADGTSGNEVVNFSQFPQTVSSYSKVVLPGGFTIISGSFTATLNSSGSVTFPGDGFATACTQVIGGPTAINGTNNSWALNVTNNTSFTWGWSGTTSGSFLFNYVAFGH